MTPERLAELRKIAEAATPGPWVTSRCHTADCWCLCVGTSDEEDDVPAYGNLKSKDAKYVAAFNPTIALELLDEIKRLNSVSNNLAHEMMDLSAQFSDAREVIREIVESMTECGADTETHYGCGGCARTLESTREKRERVMGNETT